MPNPRKPTQLKAIAGTSRPSREPSQVVDLPLVEEYPDPPDWMPNAHAVKEWNRLVPILVANRLLTEGGLGPLAMMCSVYGKMVQLYAAGETPTGHMLSQYRGLANDFGLTPVAQGKVSGQQDGRKSNKFSGNGKPSA
jgi:phage terminase small subunit